MVVGTHVIVSRHHHVVVLLVDCRVVAQAVSTTRDVVLLRGGAILTVKLGASAWLRAILAVGVMISNLLQIIIHIIWSHSIWHNSWHIKNSLSTCFELRLSVILKLCLILPRVKTLIVSILSVGTFP